MNLSWQGSHRNKSNRKKLAKKGWKLSEYSAIFGYMADKRFQIVPKLLVDERADILLSRGILRDFTLPKNKFQRMYTILFQHYY